MTMIMHEEIALPARPAARARSQRLPTHLISATGGDNRFYRIPIVFGNEDWTDPYSIPLNSTYELYEMFAFGASSIVAPMGQVSNTVAPGVFSGGQNLSLLTLPDGSTKWDTNNTGHSAQFAHSYTDVQGYWTKLKSDIQ